MAVERYFSVEDFNSCKRLNDVHIVTSRMNRRFERIHPQLQRGVDALHRKLTDISFDLQTEARVFIAKQPLNPFSTSRRRFLYFVSYTPYKDAKLGDQFSVNIDRSLVRSPGNEEFTPEDTLLQHLRLAVSTRYDEHIQYALEGDNDDERNDGAWVSNYSVNNPEGVVGMMLDTHYRGDVSLSNAQLLLAMEHEHHISRHQFRVIR